jgi:hypothetical protein
MPGEQLACMHACTAAACAAGLHRSVLAIAKEERPTRWYAFSKVTTTMNATQAT